MRPRTANKRARRALRVKRLAGPWVRFRMNGRRRGRQSRRVRRWLRSLEQTLAEHSGPAFSVIMRDMALYGSSTNICYGGAAGGGKTDQRARRLKFFDKASPLIFFDEAGRISPQAFARLARHRDMMETFK